MNLASRPRNRAVASGCAQQETSKQSFIVSIDYGTSSTSKPIELNYIN